MSDQKNNTLFLFIDGDSIGAMCGRAVMANDVEKLRSVSSRIDAAQEFIENWCAQIGGIKISGGGDEASMEIPEAAKHRIKDLRSSIEKSFGYTISVGVGRNLSEAGTALLVAKLRGKNRIVYFNKYLKNDIKKAKRRVREGRASQEEYKLSEAYLEKSENMLCDLHKNSACNLHKHEEGFHDPQTNEGSDDPCPYCADNEDNRTDDCAYCQDLDAEENADGTAGMHDCPACKEYDASQQNTGGIDDCPYCQPENITEAQANPQQELDHICNCPNCPKTAGAAGDAQADVAHPDDCPECQELYSGAVENEPGQTGQGDPQLQGHETAEEVLDMLDQEPGSGAQTPEAAAKKIDNTEMPQGDAMKENVAVKENFGDAQKQNVSDADKDFQQNTQMSGDEDQDGPDMAGVLKDGLDEHAQDQKRQEVLDMVGQTLAGFKANKAQLEATKEQNQALYNSCIQMLKSMISLCELLGLKPQMAAPHQAPQAQAAPQEQAPPAPAAPQEGSPDPKARGQE